jgi:hypothetical protein
MQRNCEWAARTFALAIDAKDQRLIARLCAEACEYVDQAGLLEAAQHQVADAGTGFGVIHSIDD